MKNILVAFIVDTLSHVKDKLDGGQPYIAFILINAMIRATI